ncbi:MAG TPA: carboxymuconolactone decarboxylase family protein [Pyrinomonadaceae bacterium]|nr:carboxymuconolactone decarboxylase family protein [Pyrinomonadaceae bacterium]
MEQRLNYMEVDPKLVHAMFGLGGAVAKSGLETSLIDLINFRVSQMNGCAYCLDMHSKDLRAAGETEQRLYLLEAWRESPFYSDRERAALAWAEAVTLLTNKEVPDAVYEQARAQFNEHELAMLTLAVVAINSWNRLNIAFRTTPGSYQPGMFKTASHSAK